MNSRKGDQAVEQMKTVFAPAEEMEIEIDLGWSIDPNAGTGRKISQGRISFLFSDWPLQGRQ